MSRFETVNRLSLFSIMLNHSPRRPRLLVLCGPLAIALILAPIARAQDVPVSATSWTTLRGDAQRTGSSNALVPLPLALGWRYTSDGAPATFSASPLVLGTPGAQRVYFAIGASVNCIDAQTGAPVPEWKAPAMSSSVSAPLTLLPGDNGDLIIAASQGGAIDAFRAGDGGREWEAQAVGGVSSGGPTVVQTAGGTRIVVATDAGDLVAFTPDGQVDPKWHVSLGRFGNPPASNMALSADGRILTVIATDGRLYGVDVKMGRLAWGDTLPNATGVTPVVAGDKVVTAGLSRIAAYDATGGRVAWTVPSRGTVSATPAFRVVDDVPTLFYGTNEGNFYALDARDGSQRWKSIGAGLFTGAPIVLDNMVLAGTSTGSLVALNPKSGTVLWQYRLKTERLLSTARGGGRGGRGGRGGGNFGGAATGDGDNAVFQLVQDDGGGIAAPGGVAPGGGGGLPGGGGPFAGGGGTGADVPISAGTTLQYSAPYSITAAPAVVNGQIFVQGDDAAVYGFTSDRVDSDPPRIVEPSISLNDDANNLAALLVGDNLSPIVPGRGPFYFAAALDDVGSGIDAKSISVALDGTPVDAKRVDFDPTSGVLTVTLIDPVKNDAGFLDGSRSLTLSVRDYAGNTQTSQFNWVVDNTAPAPHARRQRVQPGVGTPTDPNAPVNPGFGIGPTDPNAGGPVNPGFAPPGGAPTPFDNGIGNG